MRTVGREMVRAGGLGLALLVVVNLTVTLLAPLLMRNPTAYGAGLVAQFGASVGGAWVVARLAPRHAQAAGSLMALPATLLWVLYNVVASYNGVGTDFGGWHGNRIFAVVAFALNLLLCGVGAGLGARRPGLHAEG